MVNKCSIKKKARERHQNLSEEEIEKGEKRPNTDIKIFLEKKNKRKLKYDKLILAHKK